MNKMIINSLRAARKLYLLGSQKNDGRPSSGGDPAVYAEAGRLIAQKLSEPGPFMAARFGAVELSCVANYQSIIRKAKNRYINYITLRDEAFWWDRNTMSLMASSAGFFPATPPMLERFALLMLNDMKMPDVLGSWLWQEKLFANRLADVTRVTLADLEPYYHEYPWSLALEGKKVLVVHPFAKSIQQQYQKRHVLFGSKKVLPHFHLTTIKAVQSAANAATTFSNWFDALDSMKEQIAAADFDAAIIGCGAYGFPLAAFVKRMGKKAVHLGGATQTLFGITGKRWLENPEHAGVAALMNEHWVRPLADETPTGHHIIENGCYW